MIKKIFFLILYSLPVFAYADQSLCLSQEYIYFSCQIKNNKILSICGAKNTGSSTDSVFYRFGSKKNTEFSYPTNNNQNNLLTYNHYNRYQTDYFRVNFLNNGFSYEVFRDYIDENTPKITAGVTVIDKNQKSYISNCSSISHDNIHLLSSVLACDTESALGCSNTIENKNTINTNTAADNDNSFSISKVQGVKSIADKSIVEKINTSCNFPPYKTTPKDDKVNSCLVDKLLATSYSFLTDDVTTDGGFKLKNNQERYLKNIQKYQIYLKQISNEILNEKVELLVKNNNSLIDKLTIFEQDGWEAGVNSQYYYLNNDLNFIWILKIIEDEENRRVDYWKEYQIDDNGYFKLKGSISCKYNELGDIASAQCNSQ